MNEQTTIPSNAGPTVATAHLGARLFPAIAIWWTAILLLDYLPLKEVVYVRTLRIGLWIFLIELLLDCFGHDDAPANAASSAENSAAAANPPSHLFWTTSRRVALGLLWRIPALILGTCLVIVWCGYGPSAQLAAFLPTAIYAIVRRHLKALPQAERSTFIRGTQIRTQIYAVGRADDLNALGPMELANRLGELNDFTTGDQTSA